MRALMNWTANTEKILDWLVGLPSPSLMPRQTDSRERLIRKAAELIFVNGYSATTVDQICAACEIKKGSFYHHFASKEELAIEAIRLDWENFKAMLDEAFSPSHEPMDRIRAFLKATVTSQLRLQQELGYVCGCPLYSLGAEIGLNEPNLRKHVDEHLCVMAKYFESAFREGHALGQIHAPDPKALAWTVLTVCEGALTLGRIRNSMQPILGIETGVMRLLGFADRAPSAA